MKIYQLLILVPKNNTDLYEKVIIIATLGFFGVFLFISTHSHQTWWKFDQGGSDIWLFCGGFWFANIKTENRGKKPVFIYSK